MIMREMSKMKFKHTFKLNTYIIGIVLIGIIVSGLYLYYQKMHAYPDTIEHFLRKYYTVSTYLEKPNHINDVNALMDNYRDCLTEEEIERFIRTRMILLNSLAAEEAGYTLNPKTINITPVDREKQVYRYEMFIEALYTEDRHKDITVTGTLYMADNSKHSLISGCYPDGSKGKIFDLLKQ